LIGLSEDLDYDTRKELAKNTMRPMIYLRDPVMEEMAEEAKEETRKRIAKISTERIEDVIF